MVQWLSLAGLLEFSLELTILCHGQRKPVLQNPGDACAYQVLHNQHSAYLLGRYLEVVVPHALLMAYFSYEMANI
jgi:hypothetical protein